MFPLTPPLVGASGIWKQIFLKNPKIPISLYILFPLIFGGISLISALIAHNLTLYYRETGAQSLAPVYWWIIIMALLTLLCSVLVLSLVLKPVMRFVKISEKMPIFPHRKEATKRESRLTRHTMLRYSIR